MNSMKLRLIIIGFTLTVLGAFLLNLKRFSSTLLGIPVVGIILTVVGIVWNPRNKADNIRSDAG